MIHSGPKRCETGVMSQSVSLILPSSVREALQQIIDDRRRPLKHILRAPIVLLSDERLPVLENSKRASVSRPMVWRWQRRFAEDGLHDLLHETRSPGLTPIPQAEVQAIVEKTLTCEPPGTVTYWTGRTIAAACGLSLSAVQRIWRSHRLQPHRVRTFKRSTGPQFAAKLDDIVGLYMSPPRHTVVLSVDEKSEIQALDHTQPRGACKRLRSAKLSGVAGGGLPLKRGKCATFTHDYVRNGTTTLFAALSALEGGAGQGPRQAKLGRVPSGGTFFGRCSPRRRHGGFIAFLDQIEEGDPGRQGHPRPHG